MTGLIVKDFLVMRKALRSYLACLLVYAAVAFTGVWPAEMVGMFMMLVVMMQPINVFSYDKQAKWDTYGLTLPVGRTKAVAARYLCILLLCLASVALTAITGAGLYVLGRLEEPAEFLLSGTIMGLIAVLMNAIMVPILYKFGPERARIMFYGIMGLLVFAGWLLLIPLGGAAWLSTLGEPTPAQIAAAPVVAVLAGLALLALSFLLSRHFYGIKDI